MEEHAWKMSETKRDSTATAVTNIKGSIVKVHTPFIFELNFPKEAHD